MKDYLIVGQGLAGMLISHCLKLRGNSFLAIADKNKISATSVAAGMYNPLVFRRITKSWMIDELLPEMYSTYNALEEKLKQKLICPTPIVKLATEDEYKRWALKQEDIFISKYISKLEKEIPVKGLNNFYGAVTIAHSGYIDLNTMQKGFHQYLLEKNNLVYDEFKYKELDIQKSHISWKGSSFKNIIFCEGAFAINNPLFAEVKYKLTKGDVLTLTVNNLHLEYIINKMAFVMKKPNGEFLCGSTYNWSGLDFTTYQDDRNYLKEKLSTILNRPFEIVNHKTAVRPTTTDRRPVLGSHLKHKNVHYFNGLGTKGVMLGPYFAKQMIDYIEGNKELHPEVSINRFRKT